MFDSEDLSDITTSLYDESSGNEAGSGEGKLWERPKRNDRVDKLF